MALSFFLKGLVIGFSIAAPVGPIGVLCIQRTLAHGRLIGFASGLGAATADAAYGCIAAFGITLISSMLVESQLWLRLIGGAFLLWLAWKSYTAIPADAGAAGESTIKRGGQLAGAFGSTLLLTLTNPATILSFLAVFAGIMGGAVMGPDGKTSAGYALALIMVLGVFLGSALWWFILSTVTGHYRERLQRHHLVWVNRGSGLIIGAFGLIALGSLLLKA
jgi:threonine/homoserine/homoserine lactone efflux protein